MVTRLRTSCLTALCAAFFWPVVSGVPRCTAKEYYQAQPILFACDGSGGDREHNIVKVHIEAHTTHTIITVPRDTMNFMLSLSGDGSADITLVDPLRDNNVVPQKLKNLGGGEFVGLYQGSDIRYEASAGAPTNEKLTFTGQRTRGDLSLRITNHEAADVDYTLGFYYFPYDGRGRQCEQGGEPLGCESYHRDDARDAAVNWGRWLRDKYGDESTAWAQVMQPLTLNNNLAVPFHRWCHAWNAWPQAHTAGVSCDAAYKYITAGGLEENMMNVYKDHMSWAMRLPSVSTYDTHCCATLISDYSDSNSAYVALGKVQRDHHLASQCEAMQQACSNVVPAPASEDYCRYLGVSGASQASDVSVLHCWDRHIPHSTSRLPLEYVPPKHDHNEVIVTTTVQPNSQHRSDEHMATTYLLAPATAGDRELPVTTRAGFTSENKVIIGTGDVHEEVNFVIGMGPGSLLMKTPLKYNHKSGTRIVKGLGHYIPNDQSSDDKVMLPKLHHSDSMARTYTTTRTKIRLGAWMDTTRTTTSVMAPHPIERVPIVFHYETTQNHLCEGQAFTLQPTIGCNGFMGLNAQQCQDKCSANEQAPHCPRMPCLAMSFVQTNTGGWCHFFAPGQCLQYKYLAGAVSSKKIEGGGSADGYHTAPVARPAGQPGVFTKEQAPALVGGIVGGAAVGGALMAAVGAIISNIKGDKAPPPRSGAANVLAELRHPKATAAGIFPTTVVLTTAVPPTTSTTTTKALEIFARIQDEMENSTSGGPTVPLVCLGLLVVCGLCALLLAALLDPCQRKRKRHVGTIDGGSVASVGSDYYDTYGGDFGSVASVQSLAESEDYPQDSAYYPDGYYNTPSVSQYDYDYGGSVAQYGGSQAYSGSVAEYGHDYDVVPQQDSYQLARAPLSPVKENSISSSTGAYRQPQYVSATSPYVNYR